MDVVRQFRTRETEVGYNGDPESIFPDNESKDLDYVELALRRVRGDVLVAVCFVLEDLGGWPVG